MTLRPDDSANPPVPFANVVALGAEPDSPLSESHFLLLRQVVVAHRPVRNAVRVARTSAISILAVGVLSLPCLMIVPGWLNMGVVFGICVIGIIEYSGAVKMRQGLPEAAGMLGTNQLALLGLIVIYCLLQMISFSSDAALSAVLQGRSSELSDLGVAIEQTFRSLAPLVVYTLYSLVIVLSAIFQGGLAVYYFSRRRYLEAAQRETPAWIRRVLTEVGV